MGLFGIFKRRRRPMTEDDRRALLLKNGRLTDGKIIDTETDSDGCEVVYFVYSISGADFEASEKLTKAQMEDPISYAPGAKIEVLRRACDRPPRCAIGDGLIAIVTDVGEAYPELPHFALEDVAGLADFVLAFAGLAAQ